mmetsp:Transcript_6871/g.14163  ORF Transcript_6871/g.14163 Transcript_6871/m.14163 type:complete len:293 (-) Transcript_6871:44-922(-)
MVAGCQLRGTDNFASTAAAAESRSHMPRGERRTGTGRRRSTLRSVGVTVSGAAVFMACTFWAPCGSRGGSAKAGFVQPPRLQRAPAIATAAGAAFTVDSPENRYSTEDWSGQPSMRIGHGFDIHRMAPRDDPEVGGPVVIGGVAFDDFNLGIVAHSDGDIVYHSVVDAIFGALTLPDIGQFFPDTDPRWKGAASWVFMEEAWRQMDERKYRIGNIDVTIIAQAPRMMVKDHPQAEPGKPFDHKLAMIDNIARLLKCPPGRINVKARTHEKVDAVGEKRAVSCHVVAVLERIP